MSGEGDGREVRYGFCAIAADRAAFDVCGVMRVMSSVHVSSHHRKPYQNSEQGIQRCVVYMSTRTSPGRTRP